MNTVIGIPSRDSGLASRRTGKKMKINVDTARLRNLSDQLSELIEELNDIKEDLNDMLSDIERKYDVEDYADGEEDTPYDQMQNICDTVDGAYQELNEALDEMEELL